MKLYSTPSVKTLGSLHDLTQSVISKTSGSGDVIVIGTTSTPVPGGTVTSVS
jgi:hypothetical protein